MSDVLALGVLDEAQNLGLRVPEDLAIVGFDDVPDTARAGLSSVTQPHFEKGRKAEELLIQKLHGENVTSPERFDTQLVIRHSSNMPRKADL